MKFDHVLLGLLAIHPRSGWDLKQWLAGEGQFVRSNAHQSQIYRLLNRMAEQGWVAFETDPRDGRPDAKVYRLTGAGRAELVTEARSPYRPTSRFQDPDFMARFYFTGLVAPDRLIDLIDTELAYRRRQVATMRGRDRSVAFAEGVPEADAHRVRLLRELTHQYGASAVDAWLDWLERTRRLLGDALPDPDPDPAADPAAEARPAPIEGDSAR
ncbi:PadR family transcriptional regulator [Streptomyces sp. BE20]|uniref:PadR family transcriptional regulator n=1 Tax=Streptomyces sp. BE20 TaxID=3002525 RepID=UPI002E75CE0A|nr:PadR family transcriptional regulator [Streptomyces sp. BE20]MEE1823464.1 PadR family transcriptional regulator [Streptomyces sp. BE20]